MTAAPTPARTTASLLAAALLAATPAALAQHIEFEADFLLPTPGEPATITMLAGFNPGDYAMAGIGTSVVVNSIQGELTNPRLVAPMDGPGTSGGVLAAGGGVDGIIAGQLNFPIAGIYADPTNPIAFWQVDWFYTPDGTGDPVLIDIETATTRFDVYFDRERATSESRLDALEEGQFKVVIPAPAGAFALLGGLALTARRRR